MEESSTELTVTKKPKDVRFEKLQPKKETYPDTHARDLFHPASLQELSEKLKESNGKAFICVHPFYLVRSSYKGYLDAVMRGSLKARGKKRFWTELGKILPKLVETKVPIIFLQEMTYLGDHHAGEREIIQAQYDVLYESLGEITDISDDDFFVIYTKRGSPYPLKTEAEKSLENKELIDKRMEALKSAGLKVGIIAGGRLEPSEGESYEYYPDAESNDWGWGKDRPHKAIYGDWRLKDLFDEQRGTKVTHPLQKIRLDHCLGEFARMLGSHGIYPAISRLTYPAMLRKASEYKPETHSGETVYR